MTFREAIPPVEVTGRGDRPGTVVAAAVCFWLAALLLVAQVGQVIFDLTIVGPVTRQAGAATGASAAEVRNEISSARLFDVITLLVVLVLAVAVALSAVGFVQRNDRARIVGLVAASAALLCCSLAVVGSLVGGYQPDASEFQHQVTQLQDARTPDWTNWSTLAALGVYPLLITGMVLLLVASSRRYFQPFAEYYVIPLPPRD